MVEFKFKGTYRSPIWRVLSVVAMVTNGYLMHGGGYDGLPQYVVVRLFAGRRAPRWEWKDILFTP